MPSNSTDINTDNISKDMYEFMDNLTDNQNHVKEPGHVIAIIGTAKDGPRLEPIYGLDKEHVDRKYTKGDLVDAYSIASDNGAEHIYLIKVDYRDERQKYLEYKYAYQLLEALNIDIIVPLDFKLSENIIDYPDFFQKEEDIIIEDGVKKYQLDYEAETINNITYKGKTITDYNTIENDEGAIEAIEFNFTPFISDNEKSYFNIKYKAIPELEIECIINSYRGNIEHAKVTDTFTFNAYSSSTVLSEKEIVDYFADDQEEREHYLGEGWHYTVTTDLPFVKLFYNHKGNGKIYYDFDYEKYRDKKIDKKYFIEELAASCAIMEANAFVESKPIDAESISRINNIKDKLNNKEIEYGRYITTTPNSITNNDIEGSATLLLAGLCGAYPSNIPITNKPMDSDYNIGDDIDYNKNDIKILSKYNYTVIAETIRNGIVPHKAVTLASDNNPYQYLKVSRTMNELATRIEDITDEYYGYSIEYALNNMGSEIQRLLNDMHEEDKITGANFNMQRDGIDTIKINLGIGIEGEVNLINNSIYAEI